jgi:hypothetical protein
LAVFTNRQGNGEFSWLLMEAAKQRWTNLTVSMNCQERRRVSWAVYFCRQANYQLTWCFVVRPRKVYISLAIVINSQVNKVFAWLPFNEPPS